MDKVQKKNILLLNFIFRFAIIFLIIGINKLFASQGIASTGNWGNNSTWSFNGVNRVPTCGDTLSIPSGVTVTINSQLDYLSCPQNMFISVTGILQFTNGNKLELPCSSSVVINSGGFLKKSTAGGGSSTQLKICSCQSWTANDGPISGPIILNCSLLPISLLSFSASETDEGVNLSWMTSSETNNQFFTCERSVNSKDFIFLDNIKGAGNSTEINEYSYVDKNPLNEILYYRLKQTDYDGNFSYSDVVAIKCKLARNLKISNLFLDESRLINVSIINTKRVLQIRLMEISGKLIYTGELNSAEGNTKYIIPVSDISAGSYLITISNGEEIISENIFIGK